MRAKVALAIVLVILVANASAQSVKLTGAGSTFRLSSLFELDRGIPERHTRTLRLLIGRLVRPAESTTFIAGAVDFGATDAPLTDTQMAFARTRREQTYFTFLPHWAQMCRSTTFLAFRRN